MSDVNSRSRDFSDVPDSNSITGVVLTGQPLSVFDEYPRLPSLAAAINAVKCLVTDGKSFLPPILYITSQIPHHVDRALSPLFSFVDFEESSLLEIADSKLFPIIQATFMNSDDVSLLLGCCNLVAACGCASKDCLVRIIESGLHSSLFACLPRLPRLGSSETIVGILDALTIIWKRLSWLRIRVNLSPDQLDAVFSVARPLSGANDIPFVRFLHCLMVSGFLDPAQTDRVANGINAVLYRCFLRHTDQVDAEHQDQLGQLAEIVLVLSRSSLDDRYIILSNYKLFDGIAPYVHLLPPVTATQFLSFFDNHALHCDPNVAADFLSTLPCDQLLELLEQNDPPLSEAILNIISLVIERQCITAGHIIKLIDPGILGFILKSIGGVPPGLSRAAIRFIHAVVGRSDWSVLPGEAFSVFMKGVINFMPSQNPEECIWFLDCLLRALQMRSPKFDDYVAGVCDQFNLWGIVERISRKDPVLAWLCKEIDKFRVYIRD
jgi:hypothetical protein